MAAAARGGAGGLVAHTMLPQPYRLPAEPSVVSYGRDGLLTNQRGSHVSPADVAYPGDLGVPVIASLAATAAEVADLGPRLVAAGAQALEFATVFLSWPEAVAALKALRLAVNVPIWAKLSLRHGEDIAERAAAIEPFVDAFVCMSGFGPVLDIDVDADGAPRVSDPYGYAWLSGAPIHPIAVRTVFQVARRVAKPVIASGGAMSARDVVEFLQVGASLVQVTTLPILKGPAVYSDLTGDLNNWLDQHGYAGIADVTRVYLKKWRHGQRVVITSEEAPQLDEARCTGCTICGLVCYWEAIVAKPKALPIINPDNCFECGLCVSACPEDALSFRPRTETTLLPAGR